MRLRVATGAGVIGNDGWSYVRCGGCDRYVLLVVEYGEEETFGLCRVCVLAGAAAVEAVAAFAMPRRGDG